MTARELRDLAQRWPTIDKQTLVDAGVITGRDGAAEWKLFNDAPMAFILKLNDDAVNALASVLNNPHA